MSSGNKPDFSNVQGGARSTEAERPDFSNVQGGVQSTERSIDPPEQTYTVVKGDSLSRIAKRFYDDANAWPAIFEANRDQLDDPDRIKPGQELKIPARG
ncbi:peptidoglycan-binding protein [Pseudoxanthomonas broegbernensis]|uniref:Potassium binding protein Kbp n=1 Tax=Pseudoxanthomonas broegbernensis TaxID=83619 RepID=A0A7V8GNC7_9GAMM|nr:LysM peptidoglycan-binding domain-containing protein [Pseudoxanthomonas broegbernensis]KAF1686935.1 peptidoglycan-binding protein [Pseudoxanthomonas broegbernensis]MBB6065466.1 nucleoid-associated protein YgaU [Pseudoxanthomonas broegbernensis]